VLVRSAATFAELLEAELKCTNVRHAASARNRPLTAALFVFDLPRSAGVAPRRDPLQPFYTPTQEERATGRAETPPTPKIRLNACERRALAALNDLGADLGESLSLSTLRRAFRRLARRYHPDRHPGSSAAEHERMARVFVEVTEHYRVLAAALTVHRRSYATDPARS
jgi:hypothetical protein